MVVELRLDSKTGFEKERSVDSCQFRLSSPVLSSVLFHLHLGGCYFMAHAIYASITTVTIQFIDKTHQAPPEVRITQHILFTTHNCSPGGC
jgi:hypothetical protein